MNPNGVESNDAHPHSLTLRLGRRKSDVTIIFEWAMPRGLVKCNLAYVAGTFLEEIPSRVIPKGTFMNTDGRMLPVMEKIQMGMVLVQREWGNVFYFMNEHRDWSEEDYFREAQILLDKRREADERFESENG